MEVLFRETKKMFPEMKLHIFTHTSKEFDWIDQLKETAKLMECSRLITMVEWNPTRKQKYFTHVRKNHV